MFVAVLVYFGVWFCRQSTESCFPCPGGGVLPGAGALKFGHMLCWRCELPQMRLAPRQLPLGGSPIILPFYTFLPRFGGKIMSELKR